ncbi:hypothetical protein [Prevotella melaninogenica]|uniref:hypothetical protein n=1 Tax=Prevotella melaninogenica TaxID=28132 RepID=UPI001C5E725E|nr:hypothetical protein [Prevotella melaninogenica]MBW4750173.1 hypothetical protein [Prevotella melaninogenica]
MLSVSSQLTVIDVTESSRWQRMMLAELSKTITNGLYRHYKRFVQTLQTFGNNSRNRNFGL